MDCCYCIGDCFLNIFTFIRDTLCCGCSGDLETTTKEIPKTNEKVYSKTEYIFISDIEMNDRFKIDAPGFYLKREIKPNNNNNNNNMKLFS